MVIYNEDFMVLTLSEMTVNFLTNGVKLYGTILDFTCIKHLVDRGSPTCLPNFIPTSDY